MGHICLKTTSLQLEHYMHKIYITLLSTTCVKIQHIPYAIFETISYFPQHNSSISFKVKGCILLTEISHKSANYLFVTAQVKIHQISHVIFQTKREFFFKFWMTVQCDER